MRRVLLIINFRRLDMANISCRLPGLDSIGKIAADCLVVTSANLSDLSDDGPLLKLPTVQCYFTILNKY